MSDTTTGSGRGAMRPTGGLAATAAGACVLTVWLAGGAFASAGTAVQHVGSPAALEHAVATLVLLAGAVTACWYASTALVGIAVVAGHGAAPALALVRRWGPRAVRRMVLSATAAGAGLSVTVGAAAAGATPDGQDLPTDLGWGTSWPTAEPSLVPAPSPTPPAGPARPAPTAPTGQVPDRPAGAAPPPADGPAEHRPDTGPHEVQPGDSLWSIAANHLGTEPAPGAVAEAWPCWYAANRDVVGPDPDLIHPGQVLSPPNKESSR